MKISSIDFWNKLEEHYLSLLDNEALFNLVEGLIGFGLSNRGTTEGVRKIQEKIIEKGGVTTMKTIDKVRLYFGLSLLPEHKIVQGLLKKI